RLADLDAHALALELLEARQLRVDLVGPRRERAHEERPVRAADDLAEDAAGLVAGHDRDAGQHRVLRVDDAAAELTGALLRGDWKRAEKRDDDDGRDRSASMHRPSVVKRRTEANLTDR